jgi:tetratricopeptide (TPR) repeat protein
MNRNKNLLVCGALAAWLALASGVSAQVVGTARRKVPQDPAAVSLNQMLADAQTALDRKDYSAAAKDYQSYLEKKPDDAAVHFQLAYTYTALQQLSDARPEYQRAIDLDPKMTEAYLNLGLTLVDSDPAAAIPPLLKAVELKPDQPEARFALALSYEKTGKLPEAADQYAAAEKLDAKSFDTHISLARVLLLERKGAEAETEFRAAIAIQPGWAPAHLGLAQSLTLQNKLDAAAAEYAIYVGLNPNDPAARAQHASMLYDAGKDDEALAELDAAAGSTPEALPALRLRALILMRKKNFAAAVPVLQKAVAFAPKDPTLPAELGHAYLEAKDYPNAVSELILALTANPSSLDVLTDLVLAEYLSKNYPAALHGLDVLSQHETLPLASVFVRATCYDKLGQKPEALAAYQKFLEQNKDENSDMYFEAAARARTLARELKDKKR